MKANKRSQQQKLRLISDLTIAFAEVEKLKKSKKRKQTLEDFLRKL